MQYTTVTNCEWADQAGTLINCRVKFAAFPSEVPFTASASDPEAHGRDIFRRAVEGDFGPIAAYVAPPPAPALTRTYKADIWRRATDAEAETIDAALSSQSIRLQRMWSDALYLEATDDLYPTVQAAFTQFFGEARAAELLAPTE